MTSTEAISTSRIAPVETGRALPVNRVYRLKKELMAVKFDRSGNGQIVSLPKGAELEIVGFSCLSECFEVVWRERCCSVFEVDLLGTWSSPIAARRQATQGVRA